MVCKVEHKSAQAGFVWKPCDWLNDNLLTSPTKPSIGLCRHSAVTAMLKSACKEDCTACLRVYMPVWSSKLMFAIYSSIGLVYGTTNFDTWYQPKSQARMRRGCVSYDCHNYSRQLFIQLPFSSLIFMLRADVGNFSQKRTLRSIVYIFQLK
jgi:hypothetical protein